ncbi:MAG TPA: hypothetical protein VFH59_04275, partial [Frateuria sp.]|uniref:hypothetical protein n=1 Tax=Frateuria sp. TaxID=2211372 RepID=UPI002D7E2962
SEIVLLSGRNPADVIRSERKWREDLKTAGLQEDPPAVPGDGTDPAPTKGDSDPAAAFRTKVDAYGIGVRGGVITPQAADEDFFRSEAGLPAATDEVHKAWGSEPVRRPITLTPPAQKDGASATGAAAPAATEDPANA